MKIDIPPDSLATQQRLQVEGHDAGIQVDPVVLQVDVTPSAATLHDLRADTLRVKEAAAVAGYPDISFPLPVLQALSPQLRTQHWSARLGVRDGEVVAFVPAGTRLVGLAVDIGTTKIAGLPGGAGDGRDAG